MKQAHQCPGVFCSSCGTIQPPFATDHFSLFELPQTYDLDAAALAARFKSLQRRVHPDRFCTKSEQEQEYSSAHAAAINTSFRTLADPLARARYLLSLRAPALVGEGARPTARGEVLATIMELREEVADAADAGDTETLMRIFSANEARLADFARDLAPRFAAEDWAGAAGMVEEMAYYRSLGEELKALIPGPVFEQHGIAPNQLHMAN